MIVSDICGIVIPNLSISRAHPELVEGLSALILQQVQNEREENT
jgi:hypothetical protein